MNSLGQHQPGYWREPHPYALDFGARAYLSYIASGFSFGPEVSALSFCLDKEIT
jgi:hypothetical protein